MKKIISILLALSMVVSLAVSAFAGGDDAPEVTEEKVPVILVRGMNFGGLYLDYGTENERPAITVDAGEIVKYVFKALATGIFTFSFDNAMDVVIDCAFDILGGLAVDELGESVHNIGLPKYPLSADNYSEFNDATDSELGMVRRCVEEFGAGYTYYVNYDWRLDPFVVADEIDAAVKTAIETTGCDKVNIVCCSMGGLMTMAYLTEYGYDSVNRVLFMSSAFCGGQVASDLFSGRLDIDPDMLYDFVADAAGDNKALAFLLSSLHKIGVFNSLTKITDFITENYEDEAFEGVINPVFSHMLSFWGLVQPEDYKTALNYVFGDNLEPHAEFIKKTDRVQNMLAGRNALLEEMLDNGVEIAVVAHYDSPLIPVYENANFNGDGILETYEMSGYATVARYGKTLGDDYVAENPEYLSPDRVVDLSTAILPEYTYIIKGAPHVAGNYGTEYSDFLIWLLTYDGEFYAGASDRYPQFMISGDDQSLKSF
ncbi:MAG: hypothetical protein IJ264_04095 [Clostridia bacterium]|nr:hypothetical protein [Clostridia bacterium]